MMTFVHYYIVRLLKLLMIESDNERYAVYVAVQFCSVKNRRFCWVWHLECEPVFNVCVCAIEPIVPDLTGTLEELKRIKEEQDAKHAQELQEAEEKFENMKELLLTENALLR